MLPVPYLDVAEWGAAEPLAPRSSGGCCQTAGWTRPNPASETQSTQPTQELDQH